MRKIQVLLSLLLTLGLTAGFAAGPAIGVAIARGDARIDNAAFRGNSTVFEGSAIETAAAASEVQLKGGARMHMAAASAGRVYRDRLELRKGQSQLENGPNYRIEAFGLQVAPGSSQAAARVTLPGTNLVHVAALRGAVVVSTKNGGVLLANVAPGKAVLLDTTQASGAAGKMEVTGVLLLKDGHYVLTDETAGVTVEVIGDDLNKHAGKRVHLTGTIVPDRTPVAGASQVIRVVETKRRPAAAAIGAGAAGGAGAAAGMKVATKAIIVGVVVAGAAAGTTVGLTRGEDTGTVSR